PSLCLPCCTAPSAVSCGCPIFSRLADPPHLPSLPTRRSSDLGVRRVLPDLGDPGTAGGGARGSYHRAARAGTGIIRRKCRTRRGDRKSTRLNSSHVKISYAVFCLKKKKSSGRPSRSTSDEPER